jgi:hypothetical protein
MRHGKIPLMNPIRELLNGEPPYRIADKIGMPRNTLYKVVRETGIPESTTIRTIAKIASYFGYRVEIQLVKDDR